MNENQSRAQKRRIHSVNCNCCICRARNGLQDGDNNPAKQPLVRKKISKNNAMYREDIKALFRGDKNPSKRVDVRSKLRELRIQAWTNPKYRKKQIDASASLETHTKRVSGQKNRKHLDSCNCAICRARRGQNSGQFNAAKRPEVREVIKHIKQELWRDIEFASRMMHSFCIKPNKPELQLQQLLEELDPGNWRYVGDGQFFIDGKCPDFVHMSKKKIIEMFGDYWHSKEVTGVPVEQHVRERTEHFERHGHQTLIVWEHELQNLDILKRQIFQFLLLEEQ